MSEYQPEPGQNSTTVAPGFSPQNRSDSAGWRKPSRARSPGARQGPATAASIVTGLAVFGVARLHAASAPAPSNAVRREKSMAVIDPRPSPPAKRAAKA